VGFAHLLIVFIGGVMDNLEKLLGLLTNKRLRNSGSPDVLRASESDKGRIIHSASFKRMQQKTQVFPLETNAAVRSRLTHSIEVAQVGRYLAQEVTRLLRESKKSTNWEIADQVVAFTNTVENACLLHDIGNPPFGHLGESAISDWFLRKFPDETSFQDFHSFDGNPQGFRVASYQSGFDEFGLNLTASCLLSTVKYPYCLNEKPPKEKKYGLFAHDVASYKKACELANWTINKPFPLMLLMDAADDIANSMGDLEDAMENNVISFDDLLKKFSPNLLEFCKRQDVDVSMDESLSAKERFLIFKTTVINQAVKEVAERFNENIPSILKGDFQEKLLEKNGKSNVSKLYELNEQLRKEKIFTNPQVEKIELFGKAIITGLLDEFEPLLSLSKEKFVDLIKEGKGNSFHVRLVHRISKEQRDKYLKYPPNNELTARTHMIIDFISGMTDDFSVDTYQLLRGVRF
jgi:dGTPase